LLAIFPHGDPEEGELSDSRATPATAENQVFGQPLLNAILAVTDRWSYLTGQVQAWWLFAPDFPTHATFPVVELRWDDEAHPKSSSPAGDSDRVRLHSILEPEDPHSYFHSPGSLDRLFHYESRLGLILTAWDQQSARQDPDIWRQAITDRVHRQWRSMRAYLGWRVTQFEHEHPDAPPPKQVILSMRIYPTLRPDQPNWTWRGPTEQALARWRPDAPPSSDYLPVEMCDPVSGRFLPVSRKN